MATTESDPNGSIVSKSWTDKDFLHELHINEGMGVDEISNKYGVGAEVVQYLIEQYDLNDDGGDTDRPWRDEDTLYELYVEKDMTTYDIADKLDCNRATVSKWLQEFNIEIRDAADNLKMSPYRQYGDEKEWRDEDTMHELYVEEGMTTYEIADELGCSQWTVSNWLDKFDIETRNGNGEPWRDEDTLRELYIDKALTQEEIAERLGCHMTTIGNWLHKFDIPTRDSVSQGYDSEWDEPWHNKETLREMYVERNLSIKEIAQELGCNIGTVEYWIDSFDFDEESGSGQVFWQLQCEEVWNRDEGCVCCGMSIADHQRKYGTRPIVYPVIDEDTIDDGVDDLDNYVSICIDCRDEVNDLSPRQLFLRAFDE